MASVIGMPGGKQLQQTPYVPADNAIPDTRSDWSKALDRGVSQSRALQGAFANALGEATGIDFLAEWGEERMDKYLEELQSNPPEVHAWDDIDGLAAFGTYVVERVGEQIPALATQLGMYGAGVVAGGAVGGVKGAIAGARGSKAAAASVANQSAARMKAAQLGKALKRKVGNKGFEAFKTTQAQKVLGMAGATGAGAVQNIGESQMNFLDAGIDSPGNAILTGVSKAALDMVGFERLLRASQITGKSPQKLLETAAAVVKETKNNALVEGATEGMQTAIDQMAVAALSDDRELFTKANMKEIVDSMIAGATVAGAITPVMASAGAASRYAKERSDAFEDIELELNEHDLSMPDEPAFTPPPSPDIEQHPEPPPVDEGMSDIDIQLRDALADREAAEGFDAPSIDRTEAPSIKKPENMPAEIADEPDADLTAQFNILSDPSSTKHSMFVPMGNLTQIDEDVALNTPGVESVVVKIGDQLGTVYTNTQKNEDVFTEINRKGGELTQEDMGAILYDRPGKATDSDGSAIVVRDREGNVVSHVNSAPETLQSDLDTMRGHKPHDGTVEITDAPSVIDERGDKVDAEVTKRNKPAMQEAASTTASGLVLGQVNQAFEQNQAAATDRLKGATKARETYRKALDGVNEQIRVAQQTAWRKPVDDREMKDLVGMREHYANELRNASRAARNAQQEVASAPPQPTSRMQKDIEMLGTYLEKQAKVAELAQAEAALNDMSGSGNRVVQQLLENAYRWAETVHPASVPGGKEDDIDESFTARNILSAPHSGSAESTLAEYDSRARAVEGRKNVVEGPDTGGYDQAVDQYDASLSIGEEDTQQTKYVVRPSANRPNEASAAYRNDPERRRLGRGYKDRHMAQRVLEEWNQQRPDSNVDRHIVQYEFQDGERAYLIREAHVPPALASQEYVQNKYVPTTKYSRTLSQQSTEISDALQEMEDLAALARDDNYGRSLDSLVGDAIDDAKAKGDVYKRELMQAMQRYEQDAEAASREKGRWEKDMKDIEEGVKDFYTLADEVLPHARRRQFEQEVARLSGAVIYAQPPGKAKTVNLTKKAKDPEAELSLEERSMMAQGVFKYTPEKKPVPLSTSVLTSMGMSEAFAHKNPTQRAAGANVLEGYSQALWSLADRGWELNVRGGPYNSSVEVAKSGKRVPQLRGDTLLKHGYLLGGPETATDDMSVADVLGEYKPVGRVADSYTQYMRTTDAWINGGMKGDPPNPIRAYRGTLGEHAAGFNVLSQIDKALGVVRDRIAILSAPLAAREVTTQEERDALAAEAHEILDPEYNHQAELFRAKRKHEQRLRARFPSDPYWAAGEGQGIQEIQSFEEVVIRDPDTGVPVSSLTPERLDNLSERYTDEESGRTHGYVQNVTDQEGLDTQIAVQQASEDRRAEKQNQAAVVDASGNVLSYAGMDKALDNDPRNVFVDKRSELHVPKKLPQMLRVLAEQHNLTDPVFVVSLDNINLGKMDAAVKRTFADPTVFARAYTVTTDGKPVHHIVLRNSQVAREGGSQSARAEEEYMTTMSAGAALLRTAAAQHRDAIPETTMKRMKEAFVRDKKKTPYASWMDAERGFANWFSDKLAHRMRDILDEPTSIQDRALRDIAVQMRSSWSKMLQMGEPTSNIMLTELEKFTMSELERTDPLKYRDRLKRIAQMSQNEIHGPPLPDRKAMYSGRKHVDEMINTISRAANAPPQRGRAQVQKIPYGGDQLVKGEADPVLTAAARKGIPRNTSESRGAAFLGRTDPSHHRSIRLYLQRQAKRARRAGLLGDVEIKYVNHPDELKKYFPVRQPHESVKAVYTKLPDPDHDDSFIPTIIVVTSNLVNEKDALAALRHEALGHMNFSALAKDIKKEILQRLNASRDLPGIKKLYEEVDEVYSSAMSDRRKAEEVLAKVAETVDVIGGMDLTARGKAQLKRLRDFFVKLMRRVGLIPNDAMTETEVRDLVKEMAGIKDLRSQAKTTANDAKQYAKQEGTGFVSDAAKFGDVVYQSYKVNDHASTTGTQRMQQAIRAAFNQAPRINVLGAIASRQAVVNALAPNIGKRLYQRSQSDMAAKDTVPYTTGVQREQARWVGALQEILRPHGTTSESIIYGSSQKEIDDAFVQLAKELPYDKKSPLAKKVTDLLDSFGDYLVDNVEGFDKIRNYFPRTYNRQEIMARYDEFNALLEKHKFKDAEETAEAILGLGSNFVLDSAITDEASFQKERKIKNNPKLIEDLVDAGFLNADPEISVRAYMERAVRRAEMERTFGMTVPSNIARVSPERARHWIDSSQKEKDALTEEWHEWNRNTPKERTDKGMEEPEFFNMEYRPDGRLEAELRLLPERDAKRVRKAVHGAVLLTNIDRDSTAYKVLDEIRAYESFRVLLGSGLASIPEMAGIFARAKGTPGMTHFAHTLFNTVTNRGDTEKLREMAHYMGVIRRAEGAAMATELTSNEGSGSGLFSKHLGKLFKWNGNDKIVEFSRIAALSVGTEFLNQQALALNAALAAAPEGHTLFDSEGNVNPYPGMANKDIQATQNAKDWLGELGISDPNDITQHVADGSPIWRPSLDTAENQRAKKYTDALNTFVNESVINPNASERPGYTGSLPGMMVFHLRSFMYSFNQVIVGGVARELDRIAERGQSASGSSLMYMLPALPFMLAAVAMFMFLGGLSDELRQRLFTFGERGSLDAAQGRMDKMLARWSDRAGFGQLPMYDVLTDPDMNTAMYELGPTAHHVYTMQDMLTKDDPQVLRAVMKSTPILSQLPTTRREIYQAFDEEAPDIEEEQAEEDKYASTRF